MTIEDQRTMFNSKLTLKMELRFQHFINIGSTTMNLCNLFQTITEQEMKPQKNSHKSLSLRTAYMARFSQL